MVLQKEEIEKIKVQLIEQINKTFPEDKKENAIEQIENMNEKELEEFLIKNNLIKEEQEENEKKCIFCLIVDKKIQSYIIEENKYAIATLEINPISKGHSLIIPKKHIEDSSLLPKSAYSLAKSITKRIKLKFNPKNIIVSSSNVFGHEIINIIPVYGKENINSERKRATPEELIKLQIILEKKQKEKKPKKKKLENIIQEEKTEEKKTEIKKIIPWFPNRIP